MTLPLYYYESVRLFGAHEPRRGRIYRGFQIFIFGVGERTGPGGYAQLKKRRWWVYPIEETQVVGIPN